MVIPYKFAHDKVCLTWREILVGLESGMFTPYAAVEHAMEELQVAEEYPESLVELAALTKGEPIHPMIDELAELEDEQSLDEIRDKLLYLKLAWLYENRLDHEDPLGIVEEFYADFDYPPCIEGFVRYMPSDEPDLGSNEQNTARLFKKWADYLDQKKDKYKVI